MDVNYAEAGTPAEYKCANCGATNCKLWRECQTVDPQLLCASCAAKDQNKDISDIDADGTRSGVNGRTDQIGWYVPAVPDEQGIGYWGYTSIPDVGVNWWKNLPTLLS